MKGNDINGVHGVQMQIMGGLYERAPFYLFPLFLGFMVSVMSEKRREVVIIYYIRYCVCFAIVPIGDVITLNFDFSSNMGAFAY